MIRRPKTTRLPPRATGLVLGALLLLAAPTAQPAAAPGEGLQALLVRQIESARRTYDIPAMSVAVWAGDTRIAAATRGLRSAEADTAASDRDLWHLGSCGKVMTAVMVLRLAERGLLDLDAPLEKLLPPELRALTHTELRQATLAQLLSHTAGLEDEDLREGIKGAAAKRFPAVADTGWRAQLQAAAIALERKPEHPPGQVFQYSNLGYIVAGVIAAHAGGKPWTQLMRDEVFTPLGMTSAGFGAPGRADRLDQPRGHEKSWKWLIVPQMRVLQPNAAGADFPEFYGPAGLIHMNLDDWAKFCRMLLRGADQPSGFLGKRGFSRLLTPVKTRNFNEYGLGIRIGKTAGTDGLVLMHTGSNGAWRAHFRLEPARNRMILMAANIGSDDVDKAFDSVTNWLAAQLARPDGPAQAPAKG